jgi:hypothetical protein
MLSPVDLQREAEATGFRAEAIEKVSRLLELLEGFRSHPFLKSRVALKGGTALNLFVFDIPRLSVDIDLNYIGAAGRDAMLAERPKVEQAIEAVCSRAGIQIKRVPGEHAGGKWRLAYTSAYGRPGALEVDVNFLLRTPLWPLARAASKRIGAFGVTEIPMLDLHELAAGKLAALFGRAASRDLFDVRELLSTTALHPEQLRLGFVVYGGISRRDWRTVSLDDLQADSREADLQLVPLLRAGAAPARTESAEWSKRLVSDCRERLTALLPLRADETEFLDHLNDRGDIVPELLTADPAMQRILRGHPGLRWKALNVRQHRGLDSGIDETGEN